MEFSKPSPLTSLRLSRLSFGRGEKIHFPSPSGVGSNFHGCLFIINLKEGWLMRLARITSGLCLLAVIVLISGCSGVFAAPEVAASQYPSGTLPPEAPASSPTPSATTTPTASPTGTTAPTHSATPALSQTLSVSAAPSEPAGCLEPPDDYTRIDLPYATLNMRTYSMLQQAAVLYHGEIDILNAITQGSYTDAEAASFGTHAGGGVVDLSVIRTSDWTILWDEIDPLILALRTAGFAAWLRLPDALYPGSPIHIHAVAVGDAELSYAAQLQVYGDYGYLAGMDGLPPAAGQEPAPDPYGDPVVCAWMQLE